VISRGAAAAAGPEGVREGSGFGDLFGRGGNGDFGGEAGGTSQSGPASAFSGLSSLPIVGGIFGSLGKAFGGQGTTGTGKPDGSQSNPIYTVSTTATAAGGPGGAGGSATSSLSSLPGVGPMIQQLGSMFGSSSGAGTPDGSEQSPFYVISSSSGSSGGGMGGLLSAFGGGGDSSGGDSGGGGGGMGGLASLAMMFMASGGRVSKGTPYIVGEDRPEVFVPDEHGKIVPSIAHFVNSPEGRAIQSSSTSQSSASFSESSRREDVRSFALAMPPLFGESREKGAASNIPHLVGGEHPEILTPTQSGKIVPSISAFANSPEAKAIKSKGVSLAGMSHREYGGSVTAGTPYLTGEKRPEVFVPNGSSSGGRATSSHASHHSSTLNLHVHGVKDADSFRQSQSQIYANYQREAAIAHMRTR
jgi:hypothetical protein